MWGKFGPFLFIFTYSFLSFLSSWIPPSSFHILSPHSFSFFLFFSSLFGFSPPALFSLISDSLWDRIWDLEPSFPFVMPGIYHHRDRGVFRAQTHKPPIVQEGKWIVSFSISHAALSLFCSFLVFRFVCVLFCLAAVCPTTITTIGLPPHLPIPLP